MIRVRTRRLLGAAAMLALAGGTTVVVSAASLPTAVYEASVSPGSAILGQPGGFTVTLTDCGVVANQTVCSNPTPLIAFDNMDRAQIQFTDAPSAILAVSPSTWTATLSGNTVTLAAGSTGSDLTLRPDDQRHRAGPFPTQPGRAGPDHDFRHRPDRLQLQPQRE